ncbi:MAG: prepilin-type N-terminal cleavage/methylation domain-containing protein [Elusimicrobia bacterium]|nr:prepilin-type N-terminal cleavage/methylation domain-containing protein [Elusimicrobiota bacterium]
MRLRSRRGVTLSELMVAMVILTVGVLAGVSSFRFISTAIAQSRLKTIATNLAQEKMEVLKNKSYFLVLVTTQTSVSTGYDPNFVYDTGQYAPETITLWGLPPLTRVVNVDYAAVSGTSVSTVPFTSQDTGMKRITVIVYWEERGIPRKVQVDSYYENPSVATLSTGFTGTVSIAGGGALGAALVQVVGSPKWRAFTDAAGSYTFQVAPGSYTLSASSTGFTSVGSPSYSVTEGIYQNWSPALIRIGSGTVAADSVYAVNPSLVISQVVMSTVQADNNFDAQYIELFNPTTAPINVARNTCVPAPTCTDASPLVMLNIDSSAGCTNNRTCINSQLIYKSTYVAPGGYFLIVNWSTVTVLGQTHQADAYFTDEPAWNNQCPGAGSSGSPGADWNPPGVKRILNSNGGAEAHAVSVWLTDSASGNTIDSVGWKHNANNPGHCEGLCIPHNGGGAPHGLLRGDQIVRFTSPCSASAANGRAYDSNSNSNDFYFNDGAVAAGLSYRPFSSADAAQPPLAGRVSTGAFVFADDGNSAGVLSTDIAVAGAQGQVCHRSSFTLVGVATGTWTVAAIWSGSSATITNVTVTTGAVKSITDNLTVPAWHVATYNHVRLPYSFQGGVVGGLVFGAGPEYSLRLGPAQGGIRVGASNGAYTWTDNQGWYALAVPTGTVTITANAGSVNASYIASDYDVVVSSGGLTSVPDFHLAKGATLKGFVTPGTGGLPNIPVSASNGGTPYEDTSDGTGYFYIFVATSPTAYSVAPILDPMQGYVGQPVAPAAGGNPITVTADTAGSTIWIGTFTIIGGMGTVKGSVKYNGSPITTGVLITARVGGVVTDPPAAVVASSAAAQTAIYSVTSQADGTYTLEVRQSTTTGYSLRAFFPVVDLQTGAVSYPGGPKDLAAFTVWAGTEYPNKDFTWP